jgi:hypothetical protein
MNEPKFKLGYLVIGRFINDFGDVIFSQEGKVTGIWKKWEGNSCEPTDFLYQIEDCESIFPEYLVKILPLENLKKPQLTCPTCGKPQEYNV